MTDMPIPFHVSNEEEITLADIKLYVVLDKTGVNFHQETKRFPSNALRLKYVESKDRCEMSCNDGSMIDCDESLVQTSLNDKEGVTWITISECHSGGLKAFRDGIPIPAHTNVISRELATGKISSKENKRIQNYLCDCASRHGLCQGAD
jgi:hypothetical protein